MVGGLGDDVQAGISSIGQGSTASVDTDCNAADEIARSDDEAAPEESVAGVEVAA